MRAELNWIPYDKGGRHHPPTGVGTPPYTTIVKFLDSNVQGPPTDAWSLVINMIESLDNGTRWIADVHYLSDRAPNALLVDGNVFELYEGKRHVALGTLRS